MRKETKAMSDPLSPDPDLERRVVAALHARGLLRHRGWAARALAAFAAAAALFAVGYGTATWRTRDTATPGPSFVLLLTDEAAAAASPAAVLDARVEEYRAWAVRLRGEGRLVGAEKLKDGVDVLGTGRADGIHVSGYFVIRAANREEALAVARTHPHLRYGGAIALREVDPV
jgi:hypothetical protein